MSNDLKINFKKYSHKSWQEIYDQAIYSLMFCIALNQALQNIS